MPLRRVSMSRTAAASALRALALLCMLLAALPACLALEAAVPRATSLLVDQAGWLSDAERSALRARLQDMQASGRAQIAVLVSSGTGDDDLAAYALRVAEGWQLGRQQVDDGLLVLVVPSTGAARIEVGYGLEGALPDVRAGRLVRDFQQRVQADGGAVALNALLDRIAEALPPGPRLPPALSRFVRQHDEWTLPIVALVMSVFTLLPLLLASVFGAFGPGAGHTPPRAWPPARTLGAALASAVLFALVLGAGARTFWGSPAAGYRAAALVFPLPLLWSLNVCDGARMGLLARWGRHAGHLALFVYVFATLTIVGSAAMVVERQRELWAVPLVAAAFASGLLAFVAGGRVGAVLARLVGHYLFFLAALALNYFALQGVLKDPAATALTVAAVFALLVAIGQTLDERALKGAGGRRWGRWAWVFSAAGLLFLLPFLLLALVHAWTGDAFAAHWGAFMSADGSFSDLMWWLSGALGGSALLVGLGGRFGGGGAGN